MFRLSGDGGVGSGIASRKLVAAVKGAVGTDNLEVQVVYQGGDGAREAGDIGIGERELKGLVGILDERVMRINLAVGQQDGLVHEIE